MIKHVNILKKNINKWKYLTEKYEYPRYEMDILLQKAYPDKTLVYIGGPIDGLEVSNSQIGDIRIYLDESKRIINVVDMKSYFNSFHNLDYESVKNILETKYPTTTIQTITLTKYKEGPHDSQTELFNHPIEDLNNSIVILKSTTNKIDYIYIHKSIPNITVNKLYQSIDLNNFIGYDFRSSAGKEILAIF